MMCRCFRDVHDDGVCYTLTLRPPTHPPQKHHLHLLIPPPYLKPQKHNSIAAGMLVRSPFLNLQGNPNAGAIQVCRCVDNFIAHASGL